MPPSIRCLLLTIVCTLALSAARAQPSLITGVYVPDLAQQKESAQLDTLRAADENGVRNLRLNLFPPVAATLAAMEAAHQHGMGVLLTVRLGLPLYYAAGTQLRPKAGPIPAARPLSAIDPALFEQSFRSFLQASDASGIKFVGIEVGDKINWAGVNGDFRVGTTGLTGSVRDNPQELADIRKGFAKYVAVMAAARRVRDAIPAYRAVPLIATGFAEIPVSVAHAMGTDQLDAAASVSLLRELGVDRVVDAYAVHFSTGAKTDLGALTHDLQAVFAACSPTKPCWLTEWNVPASVDTCEFPAPQIKLAAALGDTIAHAAATGAVAGSFWSDWNDGKIALYKCGKFLPAH